MLKKQMSSGKIATGQKRVKELQKEIEATLAAKKAEDIKQAGK
jgi:ribosomal protein L17